MYSTIPSTFARLGNPTFARAFLSQPFRKDAEDAGVIVTARGQIYRLLALLGTGGLSVVYRACRISDGQMVALKMADDSKAPEASDLLRREAQFLSRLNHPNIVKLIDSGETLEGDAFLAMELLEGQTLEQLLVAAQNLDLRRAAEICVQVASALDYAHNTGVLHRDIKPSNIMILPSGRAVLYDFGIAVDLDDQGSYVEEGSSSGSLVYASPEQLAQKPLQSGTDIYQLGLVLFEIMTGRLPFEISISGALAYRRRGPLLPDNDLLGDVALSDELRQLLESALERDICQRLSSMKGFAEGLSRALAAFLQKQELVPSAVRL